MRILKGISYSLDPRLRPARGQSLDERQPQAVSDEPEAVESIYWHACCNERISVLESLSTHTAIECLHMYGMPDCFAAARLTVKHRYVLITYAIARPAKASAM